jgi:hypothetical protein
VLAWAVVGHKLVRMYVLGTTPLFKLYPHTVSSFPSSPHLP